MASFFDAHLPEPPQRPAPLAAPPARPLDASDVRAIMVDMIASLRDGTAPPDANVSFARKKAMFPIMAQWLDPADGAALLSEFKRYDRQSASK